jgi:aminoglycoside phosphotransferase (APT) family kinase protein
MNETAACREQQLDAEPAQPASDDLSVLLAWVGTTTQAEIRSSERLATVRPAWKIHARRGGADIVYVLRCARPSGFGLTDIYTLEREARVVDALAQLAMPIPKVIGMHAEPAAMLLEFMPGSNDFFALDAEPQRKVGVIDHFIDLLATLHAATPAQLGLQDVLPLPADARAHALNELNIWEKLYRDAASDLDPLLLFGLYWLRRNAPASTRTVLVQGDTGPNQCLYEGNRISAVLDWELAHFGDPMEDLGWIAARSFFMDFGRLKQLFARYSKLSGTPLDIASIHYYRIMALVKCAIATGLARVGMDAADDIASIVSWDAVNRMALAHCFMEVLEQDIDACAPRLAAASPAGDGLHHLLGENFRALALRESGVFEQGRLQGLAQLADYLALETAQRGNLQDSDAADLCWLFVSCQLDAQARRIGLDGIIDARNPRFDIPLAHFFYRRESRSIALLQQTLGKRVQCLIEPIA